MVRKKKITTHRSTGVHHCALKLAEGQSTIYCKVKSETSIQNGMWTMVVTVFCRFTKKTKPVDVFLRCQET